MVVWVCLPNLPVHFLDWIDFEHMGNILGKCFKAYTIWIKIDVITYSCIRVEIDIRNIILYLKEKGLDGYRKWIMKILHSIIKLTNT